MASTIKHPSQPALHTGPESHDPEQTTWVQRFWRRYSPYGEFPISSVASIALHITVAITLALGLSALTNRAERPPSVSSVMVGGDGEAAPGFGDDGLPPGDGTLETGSAAGSVGGGEGGGPTTSAPEVTQAAKVNQVEEFVPEEKFVAPSAAGQAERAAASARAEVAKSGARLADAKAALAKNYGGGTGAGPGQGGAGGAGGGTGQGGGGGNGLSGRAARPARWILQFQSKSTQDYLEQFEGLGATIAFPAEANKWRFFPRPASQPSQSSIKDLANENRLYWVDERADNVAGVSAALGVPNNGVMIAFLPLALEERMLNLEKSYRGLNEDQIKSTKFGVTRSGGGYDVIVVDQVPN